MSRPTKTYTAAERQLFDDLEASIARARGMTLPLPPSRPRPGAPFSRPADVAARSQEKAAGYVKVRSEILATYHRRGWVARGYPSIAAYIVGEYRDLEPGDQRLIYGIISDLEQAKRIRDDERNVYFVQGEAGGAIKIGVAADVNTRLAEIQRMSPVPLRVLGIVPCGGHDLESQLHREFAGARRHGEWFEPVDGLLAYIARNARPA